MALGVSLVRLRNLAKQGERESEGKPCRDANRVGGLRGPSGVAKTIQLVKCRFEPLSLFKGDHLGQDFDSILGSKMIRITKTHQCFVNED